MRISHLLLSTKAEGLFRESFWAACCLLSSAFCLLSPAFLFSQSNQYLPLFREKMILYEKYLNKQDCNTHTAIKPFLNSKEFETISDSIRKNMKRNSDTLFLTPFEIKKYSRNRISVSGILDTEFGLEQTDKSDIKHILDGGLSLEWNIKEKLFLHFAFLTGQSSFPSYVDTFIHHTDVIPGAGAAYTSRQGYSYQYYSGYLSYSPSNTFNLQAGKDKHFWGDGYRSLFLSDVSNSYPFLQTSVTIWKLKYVSLFTCMKDVANPSHLKQDFLNKYGTFHYLSWNATKRLNVGLFESIVWQGTDSHRARSFDVNYLDPVIFFRPVEYSLGSSDNAFLGASFKIKAGKRDRQQFYGQLILDEFVLKEVLAMFKKMAHPFDPAIQYGWWGNKQGVQFGFKSFDLFMLKNLTFQTELNAVRPYTYSHGSVQQNYANFTQPLADPLGANFAESVSFFDYQYKKWLFETEFLYAIYGKDMNGINYGQNIFASYNTHPNEYGNRFFQGLKTYLFYTKIKVGYYLIPSANLMAEAGFALRQENNFVSPLSSSFFFIGIKTGIMNRYSDF